MSDVNKEGLTFEEWLAAAQLAGFSGTMIDAIGDWIEGIDPSEYAHN